MSPLLRIRTSSAFIHALCFCWMILDSDMRLWLKRLDFEYRCLTHLHFTHWEWDIEDTFSNSCESFLKALCRCLATIITNYLIWHAYYFLLCPASLEVTAFGLRVWIIIYVATNLWSQKIEMPICIFLPINKPYGPESNHRQKLAWKLLISGSTMLLTYAFSRMKRYGTE